MTASAVEHEITEIPGKVAKYALRSPVQREISMCQASFTTTAVCVKRTLTCGGPGLPACESRDAIAQDLASKSRAALASTDNSTRFPFYPRPLLEITKHHID